MLKLEDREWDSFFIEDVFEIQSGTRLTKAEMRVGDRPFVSASDSNNGVTAFVDNQNSSLDSNVLGVNYNGSVVENFYHPYEAIFSDDVKRLKLKSGPNNQYTLLFCKQIILQQRHKYAYGYKFNAGRMKRQLIMLPVSATRQPDWEFMAAYMREKEKLMLAKALPYFKERLLNNLLSLGALPDSLWGGARLSDLFTITIGKNLDGNKIDCDSGWTPYVTRKETTNGLDGFTGGHDEKYLWSQVPAITIGNETAKPFVQAHEFYTGTKVNILTPKKPMSMGALQFIARCIEANKDRYSYSYTANSTRLGEQRLMLPVTASGELNTAFMESEIARIENETLAYATRLLQERYDDLVTTLTLRGGELVNKEWRNFYLEHIFILKAGTISNKTVQAPTSARGTVPYLGATNRRNGVKEFVEHNPDLMQAGNCIVFVTDGDGSIGYSIYKHENFVATVNMTSGYSPHLNRYNGNFLVTVSNRFREKYSFGYKRSPTRLRREILRLPAKAGQPDWDAMSDYAQAQETLFLMRQLCRLG